MQYYEPYYGGCHKNKRKTAYFLGLAIVVIISASAIGLIFAQGDRDNPNGSNETSQAMLATTESISSKVMFVGDIFWSRRMNNWSQATELKEKFPFSGLSDFDRDSYDAWIGNMECPTDPNVTPTVAQEENLLQFNCPATYLPELAKWFNIVSLANNHTDNHGADSFEATKQQLSANNIQYFGHYDPYKTNEICEVISLPVKVIRSDASSRQGAIPFALCGYHGVFKIPPDSSLQLIRQYSKYMPVIAYPHMGVEYKPSADTLRTNLYKKMIDYGADAVLANHPHWVQNSEAYNGKLIVYSMGNFIFDQQGSAELTRSAVITMDLRTDSSNSPKTLDKWLDLGDDCKSFADDCLSLATEQNLPKLGYSMVYDLNASDNSNKVTHKASEQVLSAVSSRLNWTNTLNNLAR